MKRLLIIDGHNLFLRNFCVNPTMDVNGSHVGGILGSLRSVKSLVRDMAPTWVVVVWDGKGGSAKRRGVYAEYKAGRKPRLNREYEFGESPDEQKSNLDSQRVRLKRYLELLGVTQVEVDDIEADDTIGFMCRHMYPDVSKVVVSTDRDFLQLVDGNTVVYSPTKKLTFTSEEVRKLHHSLPENFVYVKALCGDSSDNIKGIPGVGEKTALRLFPFIVERPTDLDELLRYAGEHLTENKRYGQIVASEGILRSNVQLMQLSSPVVSSQSVRAIRHSLAQEVGLSQSEVRLSFVRDGLQLSDSDFFSVFKNYNMVADRGVKENG